MLTFGSICSGIEAAQLAFSPIGFKQLWSSEIAEFPSLVLKHHYPKIPNLGDMLLLPSLIREKKIDAPDILCGGTPCQAFSLAGWKNGLDDERGQLTMSFIDIADAIDNIRIKENKRRALVLWENVEGALNDKTNAFGNFISALAGYETELVTSKWSKAGILIGEKRNVAWRVIDAKSVGLPQQRKRLYVIASDKSINPARILFELDAKKITESDVTSLPLFRNGIKTILENKLQSKKGNSTIEVFREYTDCLYAAYGTKWNGNAAAYNGSLYISQDEKLRRLTPLECERLMGIPDDYTDIKGASLTNRYQAIGNSWAVPVIKWIGEQIKKELDNTIKNELDVSKIANRTSNNLDAELYLLGNSYPTIDGKYLNTSESKSIFIDSNIFDIVTTSDIPENLYLSPKACTGILRRKKERKINMNKRLESIMRSIAQEEV